MRNLLYTLFLFGSLVQAQLNPNPTLINVTLGDVAPIPETELFLTTTSTSATWSPSEVVNAGQTLVWEVTGGKTIGEIVADDPTFDLTGNTGDAIVHIKSTTEFVGLDKLKVENLNIKDVDLINATQLTVFRANISQLTTFDVDERPTLTHIYIDNNSLPTVVLDEIINDLDKHGLTNGAIWIANNTGALTSASYDSYHSLLAKNWVIDVASPSSPTEPPPASGDAPVITNFQIDATNKNRINFGSSEAITVAPNTVGFTVYGKTIIGVFINPVSTTGHYFIVDSDFNFWDNTTIKYNGTGDMQDPDTDKVIRFDMQYVENLIAEPNSPTDKYVSTTGGGTLCTSGSPCSLTYAFSNAQAGETWWIKAGNYGDNPVIIANSGTSTAPIKFIGYKTAIGDITDMYYQYQPGLAFDTTEMPTIDSGAFQDASQGIYAHLKSYLVLRNLQVKGYYTNYHLSTSYTIVDNCISGYAAHPAVSGGGGISISLEGSVNNRTQNSISFDASMANFRMYSDNSLVINNQSYSDLQCVNVPDYHFIIRGLNIVMRDCLMQRAEATDIVGIMRHGGHGVSAKSDSTSDPAKETPVEDCLMENNIVIDVAQAIEVRHHEVANNVFRNIEVFNTHLVGNDFAIKGIIVTGGMNNILDNIKMDGITECFIFSGTSEDPDTPTAGSGNIFKNCLCSDVYAVFWFTEVDLKPAYDNQFINLTANDASYLQNEVGLVDNLHYNNDVINSQITNIAADYQGTHYGDGITKWENSNFYGNGFTDPQSGVKVNSISFDPQYFDTVNYLPQNASMKAGLFKAGVEYDKNGKQRASSNTTIGWIEMD